MNRYDYRHTLERELKGRQVRTLQGLRNAWGIIPAGTIATITRKYRGFGLRTEPCTHCGLEAYISRVPCGVIELLPEGGPT